MKKIISTLLLVILFSAGTLADKKPFDPVSRTNRKVKGDSILRFTVTPWKLDLQHAKNEHPATYYFRRDGSIKAIVSPSILQAIKQGPEKRDYYETYRTYKSGETKLVRNKYAYSAFFNKRPNVLEYTYTPRYCDKHGNWVYAENIARNNEYYTRKIVYYDEEGYDEKEDAEIDERCKKLVDYVEEANNPLNPANIIAGAFGFGAKATYIFGLFMLVMLIFKRWALYNWFDRRAAFKITPYDLSLFSVKQLWGLIPTGFIFFPVAAYLWNGHTTAVITTGLVTSTLAGLGFAAIFIILYTIVRGRRIPMRAARWEILYSTSMCVCLWATIILGIYILVIALIVMFFAGMVFGKGASLPTADGPGSTYVHDVFGNSEYLQNIGGDSYMDNSGNIYRRCGTNYTRLGDSHCFY